MAQFKPAPRTEQATTTTGSAFPMFDTGMPVWAMGAGGVVAALLIVFILARVFDGLTARY